MDWNTCKILQDTARVFCQWRVKEVEDGYPYKSLDILLKADNSTDEDSTDLTLHVSDNKAVSYLQEAIQTLTTTYSVAIKFILPARAGYIVRSDLLELRFETADDVFTRVQGFVTTEQHVCPAMMTGDSLPDLVALLSSAIGALTILNPSLDSLTKTQCEISRRLSFEWVLPKPTSRKRIAMVVEPVDVAASLRRWNCTHGLGIDLVILSSGKWFPDHHELSHLREAFIPVDLSPEASLSEQIAQAVRSYPLPIHGLATAMSIWLVDVACAAETLGLFTAPSRAYQVSCDKHLTRFLEADIWSLLVTSTADLQAKHLPTNVKYPLVVKPVSGASSECVFKVHDDEGLMLAVGKVAAHSRTGQALIKEYIDGSEFDINFVLLNGEVLFSEISDDFPSVGDQLTANDFSIPNFGETMVMMPTKLPGKECAIIERRLHQSLLRQGFRTGVFHVEGRIKNSTMGHRAKDPIASAEGDLYPMAGVDTMDLQQPWVFLHEVNARPPGFNSCSSSLITYGVDYWALQVLIALEDWDRVRVLSQPFSDGAIGTAMVNNIPVSVDVSVVRTVHPDLDVKNNRTMLPVRLDQDPLVKIVSSQSTLSRCLRQHRTVIANGEAYGNSASTWWWLTTFLLFSRDQESLLSSSVKIVSKYEQAVRALGPAARRPGLTITNKLRYTRRKSI